MSMKDWLQLPINIDDFRNGEDDEGDLGFSGCWIPEYIWDRYERGDLDPVDIIVLCYVHMYGGEEGCIESDEYLAEISRIPLEEWKKRLEKLMKKNLIIRLEKEGEERCLKCWWDMSPSDDRLLIKKILEERGPKNDRTS